MLLVSLALVHLYRIVILSLQNIKTFEHRQQPHSHGMPIPLLRKQYVRPQWTNDKRNCGSSVQKTLGSAKSIHKLPDRWHLLDPHLALSF